MRTESDEEDDLEIINSEHENDIDDSDTSNFSWYWTAEEVQKLKDLKARGMSDGDIGAVLHRTTSAVQVKWHTLNLIKLRRIHFVYVNKYRIVLTFAWNTYSAAINNAKESRSSSNYNIESNASESESDEDGYLEIIDSEHKEEDIHDTNSVYPRRYWTAEEVQKLRDLKSRGISNTEIGKVLHRSRDAVWHKW